MGDAAVANSMAPTDANAPKDGMQGKSSTDGPASKDPKAPWDHRDPTHDPTYRALLDFRARIARGQHPFVRQGGILTRVTSPPWELTSLRVRRVAVKRFESFRGILSLNGRVPPHWQAFEVWLDEVEASLPPELRRFLRRDADDAT